MSESASDGPRYGRCLATDCLSGNCHQYIRKPDSAVLCICGCVARQHQVLKACILCDCPRYEKAGTDECQNCPHKFNSHHESFVRSASASQENVSWSDLRKQSQRQRTMRQELLNTMRASPGSHGGSGRNQGRKPKDELKEFLVAGVRTKSGKISKEIFTENYKLTKKFEKPVRIETVLRQCREDLPRLADARYQVPLYLVPSTGEKLYEKLRGPWHEAFSEDGDKYLNLPSSKLVYYYHPAFDNDTTLLDSGEDSIEDDGSVQSAKRRKMSTSSGVSTITTADASVNDDRAGSSGGVAQRSSSVSEPNSPEFGLDDPCATNAPSNSDQPSQQDASLAEIAQVTPVSVDLINIALNLHKGDKEATQTWLQENTKGNAVSLKGQLTLLHYSSFSDSGGHGGCVMIEFNRKNRDEYELQKTLMQKFKCFSENDWKKEAVVRFEGEPGSGRSVLDSYCDIVRTCFFENGFFMRKGTAVPVLEGHLMRQGKIVCPGFSAVMQQLILGRHIEEIVTTVDDIPDIELQRVIGKLYEGKMSQMNESEKELVSDFLLTNPGFSTRLDGQSQSPADAKSAKTVAAAMARQAIYYDRKSEVDGFLRGLRKVCDISKSSSLMELLLHHFFPPLPHGAKRTLCRWWIVQISRAKITKIRETVLEFIDTLSTEREATRNTRRFLKVMTGTVYPQLSVKLRFRLVNDLEDCPVKIQACFSMANVAKNDLSKEGLLSALIDYVENEPDIYSII